MPGLRDERRALMGNVHQPAGGDVVGGDQRIGQRDSSPEARAFERQMPLPQARARQLAFLGHAMCRQPTHPAVRILLMQKLMFQ